MSTFIRLGLSALVCALCSIATFLSAPAAGSQILGVLFGEPFTLPEFRPLGAVIASGALSGSGIMISLMGALLLAVIWVGPLQRLLYGSADKNDA